MKLPLANPKRPTNTVFNAEIKRLMRLIAFMEKSLHDLLHHIQGAYQRPLEVERLWEAITSNKVPRAWSDVAFHTASRTFADFALEVVLRVKFWQNLLRHNAQVPAVWLSAFQDPD